ncbi:PepSY domain-containing protein [Rhizobium sp. TH2]|uniref:PepSY domain-containing protein n=1 Tax=Rhizobium sp. TH2 TaxID=2775403 RepID=UPI0021586BEB|nr:PepSY domain-containing protein [Rhizobium sp. TH2]UVC10463.1 PepSY domain-containing protein [Rhizobium sp. TH2]
MKRYVFFAAFLALTPAAAIAQEGDTTGSINPPVVTDDGNANMPVPGENSFTEPQVRERLAAAGYTGIGHLDLESDGVWRTTAMKDDTLVSLGVDHQGNIVEK